MDNTQGQVKDLIERLQRPVPDLPTLLALLSSPLACLGLLPPQFRQYNTVPLQAGSVNVYKHISPIQRALLVNILPTWDTSLAEAHATPLLEQYFCPDMFSFTSSEAGNVANLAYSTILSQPLTSHGIHLLSRLTTDYPVDRLHAAIFTRGSLDQPSKQITWEDCVRNVVIIPGKVANAIAGNGDVPPLLEHGTYLNNLSIRCESLIASSSRNATKASVPSISYLLAKLVNQGVFPSAPPVSRTQPSFFNVTLPVIRTRLEAEEASVYSSFWSSLLLGLPSSLTLQSILTSLLASFSPLPNATEDTPLIRALVKRDALLLNRITGYLTPDKEELWESACAVILRKDWDIGRARLFVCWLSGGAQNGQVDERALGALIANLLETWSSPDHIKHSLLIQHQYLTSLLLIAVSYLPSSSQYIPSLSFSPSFISGIGTYVAHLDVSVRRCGMLAAEVVAHVSGKQLDFSDWDGDDSGKAWARELRRLLEHRDVDANIDTFVSVEPVSIEKISTPSTSQGDGPSRVTLKPTSSGYDSDDSIAGYASPSSSRSASPTPSELEDIEKDPSLNVGLKKVARPVYLAQLGELLRSTGGPKSADDPHEADKIEMALNCSEELIRKKRGYGTELDENAVNLAYGLLSLQDNYELEGFDTKRQHGLNALVACCPRKAAPALIEEFFKNQYSTTQRYAALNALVLGAREMASLPLPPSTISVDRISFPSKKLPPSLHRRYLTAGGQDVLPLIMDTISSNAIEKGKDESSDKTPEIVRERRLRMTKPLGVVQVSSQSTKQTTLRQPQHIPFVEVATEFFIAPLINRFWLFLRDEQSREERTAHRTGRQRYYGAGTGLILNPVVLSQFLRTLAILVHASQNAPEWLAIVGPDALELAVTIGTRRVSRMDSDDEKGEGDEDEDGGWRGKEAAVVTSALELTLVVLDGCLELDGGRVIGLEHTTLLLGIGEWAGGVFSALERGLKMQGGGGTHEIKLRRAAAGVLLKVDDMTAKWRRSMLDTR